MKVLHLTLQGFGPYAEKQELDMEKLCRGGLYLITGETGAGKTTIFDAICFALYDQPSGDSRAPSMLRSKYAADNTPTEVELTFSYRDKVYIIKRNPKYMRKKSRGEGYTEVNPGAELIMPDGSIINKKNEVDKKITEIMGIDRDQFCRIAMIAQGDFRKLLYADTVTRQIIFRKIFKTNRFFMLQEALKQKTADIARARELEKHSIEQYIKGLQCERESTYAKQLEDALAGNMLTTDVIALATDMIDTDSKKADHLANIAAHTEQEIQKLTAELTKAQQLRQAFCDLDKKRKEFEQVTLLLEELRTERQNALLEKQTAQDAQDELNRIKAELELHTEIQSIQKEADDLKIAVGCEKEKSEKTSKEKLNIADEIRALKEETAALEDAGKQKQRLLNEKEAIIKRGKELSALCTDINKLHITEGRLKEAQQLYIKAANEAELRRNEYQQMQRAFRDEQAGIMASALEEGMPCPVCGSAEHPRKAQPSCSAPTEAQVNQAGEIADAAQQNAKKKSEAAGEIKGIFTAEKENIQLKAQELFGEGDIEKAQENATALTLQLRQQLKETDTLIEAENKKIKRRAEITDLLPKKEAEFDALTKEELIQKQTIAANQAKYTQLTNRLDILKAECVFNDKISAQKRADLLKKTVEDIYARIEKAEKEYNEKDKYTAGLCAAITQLERMTEGKSLTDTAVLEEQKKLLNTQKASTDLVQKELHARITANKAALLNINKRCDALKKLDREWSCINSLSAVANGKLTGKEKLALETYVQTTYFDNIIGRANLRLMTMTGGQYDLVRKEGTESKQGQSGLELDVIDHNNGSRRDVRTLSGGEAFMASLCLALGLSDEIQYSAGGVCLETMFVDEGFGSLDTETLQKAMKALESLTQGERTVGIISHVAELKDRIENRIVITKTRGGSAKAEIIVQ